MYITKYSMLFAWCILCLLLSATGSPSEGHRRIARKLGQDGGIEAKGEADEAALTRLRRPFLALRDTETASSQDAQRLYEQASNVSAISYLLFEAAEPLSKVKGSSLALLPYLTPRVLRIYASQPGLCSSRLVEELYGLSQNLYGTSAVKACHYELLKAIRATFGWVAENIPLRLQGVPGQPQATAAWPDPAAISDADFASAVRNALLSSQTELSESAAVLASASGSCEMDIWTIAALVPRISLVLTQLHGDLPELQKIAKERMHASPITFGVGPSFPAGSGRRRRQVMAAAAALGSLSTAVAAADGGDKGADGNPAAAARASSAARQAHSEHMLVVEPSGVPLTRRHWRRNLAGGFPSNVFDYSLPPPDFLVQPPAAMPKLLIGLVFHIMQYRDGNATGPAKHDASPSYAQRLVSVVNYMSRPTNIEFFVKEVRVNSSAHPYLMLKDRKTWIQVPDIDCMVFKNGVCLLNSNFLPETVSDFPQSINIYVANDLTAKKGYFGYAFTPGSDTLPSQGFIYMSWDQLSADGGGSNSLALYNDGPNTLLHELFHHLGLDHPFDKPRGVPVCFDGDEVLDTPSVKGPIRGSSFFSKATDYCLEVFWGLYGGDWEATYQRWSTSPLGIPDLDKNVWADSCSKAPGYDELGNYMTYNTPVCFAALGHFTVEQAQRAHYVTSEVNPVLYAWAQYYASRQAALLPSLQRTTTTQPVEVVIDEDYKDACRV